jgi:hypothetical protein
MRLHLLRILRSSYDRNLFCPLFFWRGNVCGGGFCFYRYRLQMEPQGPSHKLGDPLAFKLLALAQGWSDRSQVRLSVNI